MTDVRMKSSFCSVEVKNLTPDDFGVIKEIESRVYGELGLVRGDAMVEDIKNKKGMEYSFVAWGREEGKEQARIVGYLMAYEEKIDGQDGIYVEDTALVPEAQRQGIGWKLNERLMRKVKEKAKREHKSILVAMHLRESSRRFLEHYKDELRKLGLEPVREEWMKDYYSIGDDALYRVFRIG